MAVTANLSAEPRWHRMFHGPDTLADDLSSIGVWVGPRTGPDKRTHGQKEDYVLRRLLVAWKKTDRLPFPAVVRAAWDERGEPDFVLEESDGGTLGIEVTEAGEEDYQAWLTSTEWARESGTNAMSGPFEVSTPETAAQFTAAIKRKVAKYDTGAYCGQSKGCDLVVYDNTAWGGFLDKQELLRAIGRPNGLLGRFRQIHVITSGLALLDVFSNDPCWVDIRNAYEIDYAAWIFDQVERMRAGGKDELDLVHIAEELEDLGRSERRALGSHLRNLILHLLKWQFQPEKRGSSWQVSIDNARSEIHELLTDMPSLRIELENRITSEYPRARRTAANEVGLDPGTFPEDCPYTDQQLVDPEFLPDDEA